MGAIVLFLALVLASASVHKLVAQDRLAAATERMLGVRAPLARPLTLSAAAVESIAAILLLFAAFRPLGAMIAAMLWAAYRVALGVAQSRGETLFDCGCSLSAHRERVDRLVLTRPILLAALAVLVAMMPATFPVIAVEPVVASLALFSLYLAANELAVLPSMRRSLVR